MILSIITICYNNYEGLFQTIQSVASQSDAAGFEHIIIDGGSSDGSINLITDYSQSRYPYSIKYISERDNGIYNAMNKGIDISIGDYCLFLNSGDTLARKDVLRDVITILGTEDIVYGDVIKVNGRKKRRLRYNDSLSCFDFFSPFPAIHHQAAFIKSTLFSSVGKYREDMFISADWYFFFMAVIERNATTKHLNKVISICDMSGVSNTLRKDDQRLLHDSAVRQDAITGFCASNGIKHYVPKERKFRIYLTKIKWRLSVMMPLGLYTK